MLCCAHPAMPNLQHIYIWTDEHWTHTHRRISNIWSWIQNSCLVIHLTVFFLVFSLFLFFFFYLCSYVFSYYILFSFCFHSILSSCVRTYNACAHTLPSSNITIYIHKIALDSYVCTAWWGIMPTVYFNINYVYLYLKMRANSRIKAIWSVIKLDNCLDC